jgi:hypothetical protein
VSALGYSVGVHQIDVKDGETIHIDDVLYSAGSLTWKIHSPSGKPLAGAQCSVTPQDPTSMEQPRQGVTSADGLFEARGLAPGSYLGSAQMPGKPPVSITFTIESRTDTPVNTVTTFDW